MMDFTYLSIKTDHHWINSCLLYQFHILHKPLRVMSGEYFNLYNYNIHNKYNLRQ